MYFWCTLAILFVLRCIPAEDVRLLDLPPEEAEQYIENKDQTLKYAPKIETNVPAVRILGKTPTNVLEDIYLANQYHGQDGLGGYLYGYSVPDIAKTERKKAQGDLRGAYQYINGGGQEIKVQYWDDGTGFHQVDNLPEVLPKQVEDSPDVQAAKEEFFKRWHEEAARNTQSNSSPNEAAEGTSLSSQQQYPSGYIGGPQSGQQGADYPSSNPQSSTSYLSQVNQGQYQSQSSTLGQHQTGQISQGYQSGSQLSPGGYYQGQSVSPQTGSSGYQPNVNQGQTDYNSGQGQPGQSGHQFGQSGYLSDQSQAGQNCCGGDGSSSNGGQTSGSQNTYAYNQPGKEWEYKETVEEKGPPRGFFYNFDYPVGIIVQKPGETGGVQKRESLQTVYTENKGNFDHQVKIGRNPDGSSQSTYQLHL